MLSTKLTVRDIVAAGCILLAAVFLFLLPFLFVDEGQLLVITTPEGSRVIFLTEDQEIVIHSRGVCLTVVICDGSASVKESDCRDSVCKNSGKISRAGETILCAPAGVTLTVKGGDGNVDFVAG